MDENFELDETDELWGQEKRETQMLYLNHNDISKIDEKCVK